MHWRGVIGASLAALLAAGGANAEQPRGGQVCVMEVAEFSFTRGDTQFDQVLEIVDAELLGELDVDASVHSPLSGRRVVESDFEWVVIDVASERCRSGREPAAGSVVPQGVGGCNEDGCTELLPGFSHLPGGATVTVTACEPGVTTTSRYRRSGNDSWVMTLYRQEQTMQCGPV